MFYNPFTAGARIQALEIHNADLLDRVAFEADMADERQAERDIARYERDIQMSAAGRISTAYKQLDFAIVEHMAERADLKALIAAQDQAVIAGTVALENILAHVENLTGQLQDCQSRIRFQRGALNQKDRQLGETQRTTAELTLKLSILEQAGATVSLDGNLAEVNIKVPAGYEMVPVATNEDAEVLTDDNPNQPELPFEDAEAEEFGGEMPTMDQMILDVLRDIRDAVRPQVAFHGDEFGVPYQDVEEAMGLNPTEDRLAQLRADGLIN